MTWPRACILLVLVLGNLDSVLAQQASPRPNFVIFIADDLGGDDSGPYGNKYVRTPQLDKLAASGMLFTRAFLTCSSCSPSRASILTGRYPHNTGAEQLHWPLPAEQVTFVEQLKAAGYWTAAAGKWHLGQAAQGKFDQVAEGRGKWLPTLRARPADRPFFLWLASLDPHRPYKPGASDPPHRPEDVIVPPNLPDLPAVRQELALYYDAISRLDREIGEVLDELDRQHLSEQTFVLFLSDNGRPFPRAKTTVYDAGIKTPLLVRWPGHVKPGSKCASLVSSIDIAPTMLELAGVPLPASFQGVSFRPLLGDPQSTVRQYVFAEHNWHDYTAYERAVRTLRYAYIRNGYPDLPQTPPADAVAGLSFQAMRQLRDEGQLPADQATCFVAPRPAEELYDLEADPHELVNLAGQPEVATVQEQLRAVLAQWQRETRDRVPEVRTPDEADRQTGARVQTGKRPARTVRPELRAEQMP